MRRPLDPHKRWVSATFNNAFRYSKIEKPTNCAYCKKPASRIEAHHPDYDKVFLVVWLCVTCHRRADRNHISLSEVMPLAVEYNANVKPRLSPNTVLAIRKAHRVAMEQLAERFGVSPLTIRSIAAGRTWKDVK